MTTPQAGVTHDVVAHVNDSITVGLTVMPNTYRVRNAPTFLPRFSVGDPQGIDRGRWKSWIQRSFAGGAGQIRYSGTQPTHRYAESSMMDINLPTTALGGAYQPGAEVPEVAGVDVLGAAGLFAPAVAPRSTTAEAPGLGDYFTNAYPVHVLEISNRPHAFHYVTAAVYTNLGITDDPWKDGALKNLEDPLVGSWAAIHTGLPGNPNVIKAVKFSGVAALSFGPASATTASFGNAGGIRLYGSQNTLGQTAAEFYAPAWNTGAHMLGVYDNKLWRSNGGRVAYLFPKDSTLYGAQWTNYHDVGDPGKDVNAMETAFGKLFFGKPEALWVFDAGRYYAQEEFLEEAEPNNCKLLVYHRGALYFNVRQKILRLTSGGLIERIDAPYFDGIVTGGASVGDDLHILVKNVNGEGQVLTFNPESGGTREWFRTDDIGYFPARGGSPSGIEVAYGYMWMGPMALSAGYNSKTIMPIAAVNRINPSASAPEPSHGVGRPYLVSSMLDFKLPDLNKLYNQLHVTYAMHHPDERIDVYYLTDLAVPYPFSAKDWDQQGGADVFVDYDIDILTDGDPSTSEVVPMSGLTSVHWLLIGFSSRPTSVYLNILASNLTQGRWSLSVPPEIDNTEWKRPPEGRYVDGTNTLTQAGVIAISKQTPWGRKEMDGVEAYWMKLTEALYPISGRQITLADISSDTAELAVSRLRDRNWTLLGSITDWANTRKTLTFPEKFNSRELMLKFECVGTKYTRPEIHQFEIEYLPFDSDLEVVDMSVVAVDGIETLTGTRENSAQLVQASLFSMSKSGVPHVFQVPWPPPTAHTIRAKVEIVDPGALVPILAYGHTSVGTGIPIRLNEV